MSKKAVVFVDIQNDFVDGSLGTKEAQALIPKWAKFAEEVFADNTIDKYCTHDTHRDNYMETQEGKRLPVPHTIIGTSGWELIPELKKYEDKMKNFNKPTFGSMELMMEMKEKEYDEVIFVGVCTGICDISNAVLTKVALPDARIVIYKNLCACVTPETHETACKAMELLQMDVIDWNGTTV